MTTNSQSAREAIEVVCAGDLHRIGDFYDANFHDHVNNLEFHGHAGVRQSVSLYRRLFPDIRFTVSEQVSEGDRVATRWLLDGTYRGRCVRLSGITISRFKGARIVEDWGSTDSIELVRQLGPWRTTLMVLTQWRLLLALSRS